MFDSSRPRRRFGAALALVSAAAVAFTGLSVPAVAAPPTTAADAVVVSGNARFEVLSSTLIRTEYAGDAAFVDAATFNAVGRDDFAPAEYTTSETNGWLTIDTGKVQLKYKVGSGEFTEDNLTATVHTGDQEVVTHPWTTAAHCDLGRLCEAESLTNSGLHIDTNHSGFTGSGFEAGFEAVGNSASLQTTITTAGDYEFAARYAYGNSTPAARQLSVSVDGGADQTISLPSTGSWDTWKLARVSLSLSAGKHTIALHRAATDDGQMNLDSVAVVAAGADYPAATATVSSCAFGAVCDAELATITGSAKVATDHNGYSGSGFLAELNTLASVTQHVTGVPAAGSYALQVRYASATSDRPVKLSVDGGTATTVTMPKTGTWDSWSTIAIPVTLSEGANDIRFDCPTASSCGINIDSLAVTAADSALLAPHAALGGYRRGVDGVNGAAATTPGLLYTDGWYLLNDTPSSLYSTDTQKLTPRGDHGGKAYQDGYLFGYGQDYKQALGDLATLTGPTALLPRWAYGVWYSEYYNRTAADYKDDILPKFRADGVPLDVLVTDTDFKSPDTWDGWQIDTAKFPDPTAFFDWAQSEGLHNTLNIHPSILSTDPQFAQAQETAQGALKKNNSGCYFTTPADCYTFDWSDPNQLKAYMDLHQTMEKQGADFWWLDWCCEESSASSTGVTPDAWIAQQYATDTAKNIGRGFAFQRAFGSLQASGYSGQAAVPTGPWADKRTTVHFTGDSSSSWATLAFQVGYTPGEAASTGLSAVSHDIGGFNNAGDQATGAEPGSTKLADDLYARWVQLGTFQPIDRLHGNHSDRLPWQYGTAAKDSAEKFLNLRENLVPYTYTLAHEASTTGVPVTRPLYLEYPDQPGAYVNAASEYLYGPDVLVAPVTTSGTSSTTNVWFPAGSSWTDWFTGKTYEGGTSAAVATSLDTMPVFIKSGGIVATRTGNVDNDVQNPLDAATVTVAGGADGKYSLYEDDGVTTDTSNSATTAITYTEDGHNRTVAIGAAKGEFTGQVESRAWTVKFANAVQPTRVFVDDAAVAASAWTWDADTKTLTVTVPAKSVTQATTVRFTDAPVTFTTVVPTISGSAKVGSLLTADAGTWTPVAAFTYQWNSNGEPISGATESTYKVRAADAGTALTVTVTGTAEGIDTASVISQAVNVTSGDLTTSVPTIAGTLKLGGVLTASAGEWGPEGVVLSYQWLRNGAPISKATAAKYTLVAKDVGTRISVRVTGVAEGYGTATTESKLTAKVAAGKLTAATPKISGTAKVGKRLTAKPGSWKPSGVSFSYRWYRSGKLISGATKSYHTAVKADAGKTIKVKVTGKKSGYTSVAKTSKSTKKVAK